MPAAATRADSLRLELSGSEIAHLTAVGTLIGVAINAVAALNGPGTGRLRSKGPTGALLSWQAPGSAAFGVDVDVSAAGSYLIEDGVDPSKWVRVTTYSAFLLTGVAECEVLMADNYNNAVASDDVTAAEASAGDTETYTVDMINDNGVILSDIRVWLDAAVADLEISDDGAAWVSPTTEATALQFPDLAAGGSDVLHFRRTIAASSPPDPAVLNHLHFSFDAI